MNYKRYIKMIPSFKIPYWFDFSQMFFERKLHKWSQQQISKRKAEYKLLFILDKGKISLRHTSLNSPHNDGIEIIKPTPVAKSLRRYSQR